MAHLQGGGPTTATVLPSIKSLAQAGGLSLNFLSMRTTPAGWRLGMILNGKFNLKERNMISPTVMLFTRAFCLMLTFTMT